MAAAKFRFRLERVRDLRERREEDAKQELAQAMAHHSRGEQEVIQAGERVAAARDAQLNAAAGASQAIDLVSHQAYLERAERAQAASREELARRESELHARRAALTVAARDRQALDRLRDRKRAEHEAEAARQEAIALDEIALNNYRRRAA